MKARTITSSLLTVSLLLAIVIGTDLFDVRQGLNLSVLLGSNVVQATTLAETSTAVLDDPASWGIPKGEAATRRHIKNGIKAGEIDPVTGLKILYYHDPMVPGKKFEAPGKSPFMDMMLVPSYSGSAGADASTISVSSRIQQNLGLRTTEVTEGTLAPDVLAVGAIAWNERDLALVQARAMGYVEKVYVRATLDSVTKGQALFDLYVPDWVAAQEDYLSVRRMKVSGLESLLDAARQRMRQAGMSEPQIALVERSGSVQSRITLTAPIGGVLTELNAREGSTVMPGTLLARINGLSSVWAEAQVPESQAAQMRVGAKVVARSPALPGTEFKGQVQALLPEVNTSTRTFKVRMELGNPEGQLVPGMFVQMALSGPAQAKILLVPTEAIIRTGLRDLVMAAEVDGAFRPIEVEVGMEVDDKTEIRRGLQAGQKVVLSGQFLIDSEASLKGIEARLGAQKTASLAQMHRTIAVIKAVDDDVLTLEHPPIASLEWPAMTMDFKLSSSLTTTTNPLAHEGQAIEIEFSMDKNGPLIESLREVDTQGATQ